MINNFYKKKRVFITGGAGFIGYHLHNKLIQQGAFVTIGDNLSIGKIENIIKVWSNNKIKFKKTSWGYQSEHGHKFIFVDLQNLPDAVKSLKKSEIVFHLAATHGGRGFIDSHPADCSENFSLNQNVIKAAHIVGVDRVQFASSACVYPCDLQQKYNSEYLLKEDDAFKNNWANSDREYGWSKLMGEMSLKAYHLQYGLKGSITRYVTVYGPRQNDTHAIIALINKAIQKMDPYQVWGSGKQDRDFTFVDDIVDGTLLACEKITDADVVNLGTSERYKINQVVQMIFSQLNWYPGKIIFDKTKSEGVKTRALDISKAKKIINWMPKYNLNSGLKKTIEWFKKENPDSV